MSTLRSSSCNGADRVPYDTLPKNSIDGSRHFLTAKTISQEELPATNTCDHESDANDSSSGRLPLSFEEDGSPRDEGNNKPLSRSRVTLEGIAADVASVALPLALLGFTLAAICRNGEQMPEDIIEDWRNAASIVVKISTLFPVFFAAVIGRLMSQAARWKSEKGATLQSLEQLLGSRTVGGTLLSPLHLRSFNLLAGGLIVLWAFSPLGAQAILRMIESRQAFQSEEARISYLDTKGANNFNTIENFRFAAQNGTWPDRKAAAVSQIYSSLVSSEDIENSQPMDLWGNVKIPLYSSLPNPSGEHHWTPVHDQNVTFAALVGLPISSTPMGNTTLKLESTYLEANCDKSLKIKAGEEREVDGVLNYRPPKAGWTDPVSSFLHDFMIGNSSNIPNGTVHGFGIPIFVGPSEIQPSWAIGLDRMMDTGWADGTWRPSGSEFDPGDAKQSLKMFEAETGIEIAPSRLILQASFDWEFEWDSSEHGGKFVEATCSVAQRYVETEILCERSEKAQRRACRATSMRYSPSKHPPTDLTYLSFPHIFYSVSRNLPQASRPLLVGENKDPTKELLFAQTMTDEVGRPTSDRYDEALFGRRLTQILNTFIQAHQGLEDLLTGIAAEEGGMLDNKITTRAKITRTTILFSIQRLWVSLALVSCGILFLGGVASVVFTYRAVGPEVLGFASTAVRDNRYFPISRDREMSTMDGPEITVMSKDVRVRFGVVEDVTGDERLGFAPESKVVGIKAPLGVKEE